MDREKILIVDDDPVFCETKADQLKDEGFLVQTTTDPLDAIEIISKEAFSVILTDLRMKGLSGIELVKKVKEITPLTEVLLITEFASIETAVDAIKSGAYDYIHKTLSQRELVFKIQHAIEKKNSLEQIDNLKDTLKERYSFKNIIGKSEKMQEVYQLIKTICDTDVAVLIRGETGTGKELVARAIHFNSLRKNKPFIVVNCAAISQTLIESELFGHEKGAFTGAVKEKPGKLELAMGGTVFLDEIGDMSSELQAKLLRVLQDKKFERVGSNKLLETDARIISATNRDLEQFMKEGKFREDLFYRINVVNINLPPLRERIDDIKLLIDYFLDKSNQEFNKKITGFSQQAKDMLLIYSWPGNVRELENIIKKMVLMTNDNIISAETIEGTLSGIEMMSKKEGIDTLIKLSWQEMIERAEREYFISLLKHFNGRLKLIMEKAKIARRTLYQKMKDYNLRKEDFIQRGEIPEE